MKHGCQVLLKRKGWGWLILLFSVAMFAIHSPLQASTSKTSWQVEYINERLTINVDNVALGRVLAAIREKTGIEFVLSQEQSKRLISIRLESLPMVESLERMLSQFNHVFLFGPDNKPIKVVILRYAKLDKSPLPREVAESRERVILPSLAETKDNKPAAKEGRLVTSSSEIMDIKQPTEEDMISRDFLETKVTKPSSVEDMVVTPSSETMVVKPASAEGMVVVTPPTRTMANIMESMSINAFTEESKPKVR